MAGQPSGESQSSLQKRLKGRGRLADKRIQATSRARHFRKAFLNPAIEAGLVEMTIPDKPRSSRQKYRLTHKGEAKRSGASTKLKPKRKSQADRAPRKAPKKGTKRR